MGALHDAGRRARARSGGARPAPGRRSAKDVSVAGFALGGGLSFVGRRYGLAANHVTAIEAVTADGRLRRIDAGAESELFWALRGSGGGLGVVTALEVAPAPAPAGGVHAGALFWDAADAGALLRAWTAWAAAAPEGITTSCKLVHVPPLPGFPEPLQGRSVLCVQGYSLDGAADADALLTPLRAIAEPIMGGWGPTPLTALQDVHGDPEDPVPSMALGVPLRELPEAAIDALLAAAAARSGVFAVDLRQLGGAFGRPGAAGTGGAVERTDAAFMALGLAMVVDPAAAGALRAALDGVAAALAPWRAPYGVATYEERPGTAGDLADADVVDRLVDVRTTYDPDGRFLASHPAG